MAADVHSISEAVALLRKGGLKELIIDSLAAPSTSAERHELVKYLKDNRVTQRLELINFPHVREYQFIKISTTKKISFKLLASLEAVVDTLVLTKSFFSIKYGAPKIYPDNEKIFWEHMNNKSRGNKGENFQHLELDTGNELTFSGFATLLHDIISSQTSKLKTVTIRGNFEWKLFQGDELFTDYISSLRAAASSAGDKVRFYGSYAHILNINNSQNTAVKLK